MIDRLRTIDQRYDELGELMATPEVLADLAQLQACARERASLEYTVGLYREYASATDSLAETEAMLKESLDADMAELAREEVESLRQRQASLMERLKELLVPRDPNDQKDVIVEIRAGTGGGEAALFASDLFRMYARYAERKGWKLETMDSHETGIGGLKEIVFEVRGRGVYSRMKFESGVHRVQRVPATEASGRIHTSTATVAVLPEAEDVEVNVSPDDLRIDIFCSSGAGGQNVNKVASAVRITHLPTGIVVTCQDERSQLKNRTKAMAVLRARIYDVERRKQEEETTSNRRAQVGTGERSEKVRTYNFPQDRLTDHRIGLTVHNLPGILDGNIDEIVDALTTAERHAEEAA